MERRTFLKVSAATAAGVAAPQAAAEVLAAAAPVSWAKAPCCFCGVGCGVSVGVQAGRVVAVAGDRHAPVNRGLLCAKGYQAAQALYGDGRLTRPQLRKGDALVPVSWKEALDTLAGRIAADPAGFALFSGGHLGLPAGYAAQKLMRGGLGSNRVDSSTSLGMAAASSALVATYGWDGPPGCYDDLDVCDTLVVWGANPAETFPVLFSRVLDRRARGDRVTVVDIAPRRTRTSDQSDLVVPLRPRADLALVCGVASLLLERGRHAQDFIDAHCDFAVWGAPAKLDLAAYRARLAPFTPAHVERLTGVPPASLRRLADLFGDRERKIVSLWCAALGRGPQGAATNAALHGLHLLSGHLGRPGDGPLPLSGQASGLGTAREVGLTPAGLPGGRRVTDAAHRQACEARWSVPSGRIPAAPGPDAATLWRDFADPKGAVHTMWVLGANPARALPNLTALLDPKKRADGRFLAVSDAYPSATVRMADLVLPSALWVEQTDLVGNGERRVQHHAKLVDPPGEARPDLWVVLALARALAERGVAGVAGVLDGAGSTDWSGFDKGDAAARLFEEYRTLAPLAPLAQYARHRGLRSPVVEQKGTWVDTPRRDVKRATVFFAAPAPPAEPPDDDFPLWLLTGRVLEHFNTGVTTRRIRDLRRALPQAFVELHPDDAQRIGVVEGEPVWLETRRASVRLLARTDGRGRPPAGVVFAPFFDDDAAVNALTPDRFSPCAARIRRG